ncbi:MAG: electron transport complex subunit RsxC [Sulfuritalea sp.]|nr:electron transport complex subunit RsxC [Sulfuritalea sp.]
MSLFSWRNSALPTFSRGGVHPDEHKELTEHLPIEDFIPTNVYLPVSQSLGASAEPLVAKAAKVKRGDVIAKVPGGVSLHAPVSGIVKGVATGPHASLVYDTVITIQVKPSEDDPQFPEQFGWQTLPVAQMLERIRDAGVVGLGGAAFPTYRKLSLPKDAKVDTLVINGSECEPYLTCDYRLMLEESEKVVLGSWLIARIIGVANCVIGVEDNKQPAAEKLRQTIAELGLDKMEPPVKMTVVVTQTRYPQGSEKQLVQSLTGRMVPKGGLPLAVGVVVQNVATAIACLDAIRNGKPVMERVVTVSGRGILSPKNLRVPIGTSVEDIIAHCGGYAGDVVKILLGGPMMGRTIADLDVSVTKGTSGLLFLTAAETSITHYQPCISCGECVDACPMGLEPNRVSQYMEVGRPLETLQFGVKECFECGCCSYSCPSHRPLVQFMQVAKAAYRRQERKTT